MKSSSGYEFRYKEGDVSKGKLHHIEVFKNDILYWIIDTNCTPWQNDDIRETAKFSYPEGGSCTDTVTSPFTIISKPEGICLDEFKYTPANILKGTTGHSECMGYPDNLKNTTIPATYTDHNGTHIVQKWSMRPSTNISMKEEAAIIKYVTPFDPFLKDKTDLKGYWPMRETAGAGTSVEGLSTSAITHSLGSAIYGKWRTGDDCQDGGYCWYLNESQAFESSFLSGSGLLYEPGKNVTFYIWANVSSIGSGDILFHGHDSLGFRHDGSTSLDLESHDGSNYQRDDFIENSDFINEWHLFTLQYDESISTVYGWLDCELKTNQTRTGNPYGQGYSGIAGSARTVRAVNAGLWQHYAVYTTIHDQADCLQYMDETNGSQTIGEGMIACYDMENETDYTGVYDVDNAGNLTFTSGKINNAVNFVQDANFLNYSTMMYDELELTSAFSFAMWIKSDDTEQDRSIWRSGASNTGFQFWMDGDSGGTMAWNFDGQGGSTLVESATGVHSTDYQFWVGRWDVNYRGGTPELWLNGVNSTLSTSGTMTVKLDPKTLFQMGQGLKTGFDGQMDSVMFFNRFISEDEIEALYNNNTGLTCAQADVKVPGTSTPPTTPTNLTRELTTNFTGTFSGTQDLICSGSTDAESNVITYVIEKGNETIIPAGTAHFYDVESGMDDYTGTATGSGSVDFVDYADGNYSSATHSFWANDDGGAATRNWLTSPNITIPNGATSPQLTFWLRIVTEADYDGAWLDYSIDGGEWTLAATGDLNYSYTGIAGPGNPSGEHVAWDGDVGDIGKVKYTIPDAAIGANISFRWIMESDTYYDTGGAGENINDGIWVDDINVSYSSGTSYTYTVVGNHTTGNYSWDLSGEVVETYEKFRCRAIDLDGTNTYTDYYTIDSNFTIGSTGGVDTNFTIRDYDWETWVDYATSGVYLSFACTPTQTDCEPDLQDADFSASVFQVCNNGTVAGTGVYMSMNNTIPNIALKCDDDYTATGATTLTTSNQTIHGALAIDACTYISCWADYSNPTSGGYFDVHAYVYSYIRGLIHCQADPEFLR